MERNEFLAVQECCYGYSESEICLGSFCSYDMIIFASREGTISIAYISK